MGRPRLPKGEAKGKMLSLRLTADELHAVEGAAKRAGIKNVSEWARRALVAVATGAALREDESESPSP